MKEKGETAVKKKLLYLDCCIREDLSRTRKLGEAFLNAVPPEWEVTRLELMAEPLVPFNGAFFRQRETLLEKGELDHPRFRYAHQFAAADAVAVAAPFWDLSFPALLKIYIENVSVDGITFYCDQAGLHGKCRGEKLLFLTTRGGSYNGSAQEMGSRYLEALKDFFGFGGYACVAADGLDEDPAKTQGILDEACVRARELAKQL